MRHIHKLDILHSKGLIIPRDSAISVLLVSVDVAVNAIILTLYMSDFLQLGIFRSKSLPQLITSMKWRIKRKLKQKTGTFYAMSFINDDGNCMVKSVCYAALPRPFDILLKRDSRNKSKRSVGFPSNSSNERPSKVTFR